MKRYLGYKESGVDWIGEIPARWKIVRGKFILSHKKEINSDFQCDNLLSLTLNGVLRKDMNSAEGLIPSDYRTHQVFYPDNLVFKLIDLENIRTSRVGIVPEKGIMSSAYIRLEGNSDLYERFYFYQYYDLYKKHIFNFLGKGVRSTLSPSDLLEIPLVFPPPSEQRTIVNFLDRKTEQIDELIRIKERRIELLQEQRTALINQVVTKGLDPNVEMKPSGVEWIGEIPVHWIISKVKHEFESLDNLRIPLNAETRGSMKLKVYDYYGASGVIDKVENYIFYEPLILIGEDGANLLLRSTPLAFKATGKYWVNNHAHVLKPKHGNIDYHANMLESLDYTHYITGAAQPKLTSEHLMNITVIIPPPLEQAQIASFLDHKTKQIDELISTEQRKIELLIEYRQSLISEAVTGKIDVRNEV